MQKKYVIRDSCVPLVALIIFTIATYSLFGNNKSVIFYESAGYQHRVKGTVTDSNGVPIAGATVTIKDTSTGTFTNEEGVFFVNASPPDVLVITYIGFKPFEAAVGSSDSLSIVLEEDVTNLDAVTVNAGYYTVKERERTGSIAKVTSEEIELQPIVSPMQALQGRIPGVEIQQQSGVPGNAPVVRIRGRNSLRNEGNYPLYIIDGVPIISTPINTGNLFLNGWDPLSTLNLSNIESIEVLKDADATAIYGSRGANGVVLITTKKGNGYNSKTKVEISWYSGMSKLGKRMEVLNTEQYINFRKAAIANSGGIPNSDNDWDLVLWDTNRYSNWPKKLLDGTSYITNFDIAASGGNANTSFRLDGSYYKEGTVFPIDNHYNKVTSSFNLNHSTENKKLMIDFTVNFGTDKSKASGVSSLVQKAYTLPPNAPPLYDENNDLHWEGWEYSRVDSNPLAAQNSITIAHVNNLLANLGISYKLSPKLEFKTSIGYTFNSRYSKRETPNSIVPPGERGGVQHEATQNYQKRTSWIIEPQLNYHTILGEGSIDAIIGSTFQQNVSDGFGILGEGFVSNSLIGYIPSAESHRSYGDSRHIKYKYNAIYGRLGYNWRHTYYINLTGRRDGSSRFGPDKRFANFWAIGTAWIFTEEHFLKNNLPFISFGKLRGSYGTTGSDQIGDYQYLDAYEATPGPNGLYPTQPFTADFAWEENKKLEAALELGFLKDRINIGVSWYRHRSSNQLVGYPLPAITGFTTVQANLPATVENTGWEFEASILNLRSKNFSWQTYFNISFPENKLINFPRIDQTPYSNTFRIGHPLNIRLVYQFDGIDPVSGISKVVDVNGDERFDYQDKIVIKDMGRQYFGGFTNSITYKGIHLNFLFEFVRQNAPKPFIYSRSPGGPYNRPLEEYELWENGELYVENSLNFIEGYSLTQQSNHNIVDASFLRLKTLSFVYDLPLKSLKKTEIKSFRLFCAAQNLFTVTSYSGMNVDFPGGSTALPSLRTFTMGIQLEL